MIHYIYKTTNLVNGKMYIGMHSQPKGPIDEYLGSGKHFRQAVAHYGKENFVKEILLYCDSREELAEQEAKIITNEIVADKSYYNLKLGGTGGSSGLSEEAKLKISKANKGRLVGEKNPAFGRTWTPEMTESIRKNHPLYGKTSTQAVKVIVDGVLYDSIYLADTNSGVPWIQRKLDSKKYLNVRYADESRNSHKSQKFVVITGKYYSSLRKAELLTGEPRKEIAQKIANCTIGYKYDIMTTYIEHDED